LLAGIYHHEGYGTLEFRQQSHQGAAVLVAERSETVWAQHITLEHASGDYWTALWRFRDDDPDFGQFFKAKFVVGSSGTVDGLEVVFRAGADGFLDGVVMYERIQK
jgi:hypothetical protein